MHCHCWLGRLVQEDTQVGCSCPAIRYWMNTEWIGQIVASSPSCKPVSHISGVNPLWSKYTLKECQRIWILGGRGIFSCRGAAVFFNILFRGLIIFLPYQNILSKLVKTARQFVCEPWHLLCLLLETALLAIVLCLWYAHHHHKAVIGWGVWTDLGLRRLGALTLWAEVTA